MKRAELLEKVKTARKKGFSLREISQSFKISKSTASVWLRDVDISEQGKERLQKLNEEAKQKGCASRKRKEIEYFDKLSKNCSVLKNKKNFTKYDLKLFLSLLYWGEGGKTERRLVFINSDPQMITSFLWLLRNSFEIREEKFRAILHLHDYHNKDEMKIFWSKLTGIGVEKISVHRKTNTSKRKKYDYKGCFSLRYGDYSVYDEITIIIERFKKRFAGVG